MNRYLLTEQTFNRLTKMLGTLRCRKCGMRLYVGERVISVKRKHYTQIFHPKCHYSRFIELPA
jgi:hypothetical protein